MSQEYLPQRVLLIGDRLAHLAVTIQELTSKIPSIQVKEISNADDLKQAIACFKFDLVMIHAPLFWATELELVQRLKAESNCPVIILSNSGNLDIAIAAMKAGLDDYVVQSGDDLTPLVQSIQSVWQKVQSQCDRAKADLAKRQRAEVALRESETRFRHLAANVPGVIYQYILHPDGSDEVLYMSPGSQSLWEIEATAIEQDVSLVWNLVHPDDALALQKSVFLSAQNLQPWLWEWRIITSSGLLKWVHGAAQPELQPNGDIVWDGLLMDISDRKTNELLLQQQTQQVQALNRVGQSICNSLDLSTIFATATAEITDLLGVHRTTIVQYMSDRSCWRVLACHRLNESLPDTTGVEVSDEGNPYAAQIKQFQIVRIESMDQVNDPVNQEISRQFPDVIWLIIPIVLNKQIWGALSLSKPLDKAPWKDKEVEVSCKVAVQLAIAIEQAQLYQQAQQELIQRQQAEVALQRLNQELEQRVQERTQQFLQESQLRQQAETKFQKIFHTSPHPIAIASLHDRRIVEINEAFSQLFGYSREEMLGHYADEFSLFMNPADQGIVQRRLLVNGSVHNLECVICTKTGEARTVITSAEFIEVEGISCFLVTGNDLTERKQVEEALWQSEERWQLAIQGSNEGIWDWNIKTNEAFRSDRFYEILGCFKQDLGVDEQSWVGSIHPEDMDRVMIAKQDYLARKIPAFAVEYRMRCQDSTYKWVQDRAVAIWDEQGNPVRMVGSLGDISDRKQIEEQLRASLKEKEILLREVYHRVKNNMQMVSSLLNLQAASVNDPVVLRLINESQQRLRTMALIHERLYRSKNLARIDVATYVEDLVNNLVRSYTIANSSIQVVLELGEFELDLDTAVPCGLIINELVSNALKYAFPNQQGEIKLQFWLDDMGNYCLVVKDNGVGIPAHVDPQHTDSLGMQLIYGLTDQLRGIVELDRKGGSQFRITFRKR